MSSTNGKLVALLANTLGMPTTDIDDDMSMKDVESWDSLRHMQLIAAIEESYGIQLDFEEIVSMRTVAAIKGVLRQRELEV